MMTKQSPKILLKKGTEEWRVLKFLKEFGEIILDASLPKQYPEAALWRSILGLDKRKLLSKEERKRLQNSVSETLHRLKRKEMVKKIGSTRGPKWQLTQFGENAMGLSLISELLPEDGRLRLLIFDIPEERKEDRNWLRTMLITSGFVLLQKSVWIGRRPLSEEFLKEIELRNIFSYIHIFEIKESGTLSGLDWGNVA